MARITFSEDFATQKKLAKIIRDKHVADGAGSVLTAYLSAQGIDLDDMLSDADAAEILEDARAKLRRDHETNREKRDVTFLLQFNEMKKGVQVLKTTFKPLYHKLGDWSVDVTGVSRITYPVTFQGRKNLMKAFYDKHIAYPVGTSPLQTWVNENSIDPVDITANKIPACVAFDAAMTAQMEQAENKREQRDNLWGPRVKQMKGIGAYLIKLYANNPQKAGDWGFVVDESPRKPKLRKSKILLLETKTVNNIVLGSTFVNTGTTTLIIYPGKTTTPGGITVLAGENYGITKGYSTITVSNTSTLETGRFTTLVNNQ